MGLVLIAVIWSLFCYCFSAVSPLAQHFISELKSCRLPPELHPVSSLDGVAFK